MKFVLIFIVMNQLAKENENYFLIKWNFLLMRITNNCSIWKQNFVWLHEWQENENNFDENEKYGHKHMIGYYLTNCMNS